MITLQMKTSTPKESKKVWQLFVYIYQTRVKAPKYFLCDFLSIIMLYDDIFSESDEKITCEWHIHK